MLLHLFLILLTSNEYQKILKIGEGDIEFVSIPLFHSLYKFAEFYNP